MALADHDGGDRPPQRQSYFSSGSAPGFWSSSEKSI